MKKILVLLLIFMVSTTFTFAAGGRIVDLVPSVEELIGRQQVELIAELTDYKGQIGIVSATSQATNQNAWIKWNWISTLIRL